MVVLILKILYDLRILSYRGSQGIRYLGSCGICSIHHVELALSILRIFGGFPKLGVPFLGGDPHNKDCSIVGSMLRSPLFLETTASSADS